MDENSQISRRNLMGYALAAPVVLSAGRAFANTAEDDAIAALYADAIAEGGNLTIYAGGDYDGQADGPRAAFNGAFPEINLNIIVDYSKFHDVRVNNQIARGDVIPDVVQFQTIQNFPRWAEMGVLENYKPEGFEHIYDPFKDPDGAWMAVLPLAFSYMYDVAGVGDTPPLSPKDFVNPQWKGQIASSYPHDDDAALFLYKQYVDAYGWDWLEQLVAQDVSFARGSHTPGLAVGEKRKLIGIGGSGTMLAKDAPMRWLVPEDEPFMAWGQRAAIMKNAKNMSAAKLYMSWSISEASQSNFYNGWSVRTDTPVAPGLRALWDYPDGHVADFPKFMADRAEVERWKQTFAMFFGDVQGEATPGHLGPRPL